MALLPLPIPRITAPNWGKQLNDAITSRYNDLLARILATDTALDDEITAREGQANGEQFALEVKYGSSISGINNTSVALDGATLVVPPSDTAQILWYAASYSISVAGGGIITLGLYKVAAGGTSALYSYTNQLIDPNRPTTSIGERLQGRCRIAPHTDYQLFGLTFTMVRYSGSSLAMAILNGNTDYSKTSMQLVKA